MSYVIESGIPMPNKRGRPPCEERLAMLSMEVGQSFLVDLESRVHFIRCVASRIEGRKFRVLKTREGWRVWRLE